MPIKKKNRSLNRLKDLYFIVPIRRRYRLWRIEIPKRETAKKPLGVWLYLVKKFVIERTNYFTPANVVSLCRGLLSYPLYLLMIEKQFIAALFIFTVALITDFIDGHLARGLNQETQSGKLIDPLFDKTTIFALGAALVQLSIIPLWLAILTLALDSLLIFMAIILKPLASALGLSRPAGANDYGKWKFTCQCLALLLYITLIFFDPEKIIGTIIQQSAVIIGSTSLIFALGSIFEHAIPGALKGSPDNLIKYFFKLAK